MQRFFEIPELLDLAFHFVDKRDHHTLLCVSQSTFRSAAPRVWGSLGRVSDLMMLIRGAQSVALVPGWTQCIDLPAFLDASDLSRFNLYAQFIREVTVCLDPERCYSQPRRPQPPQVDRILRWRGLLDYASDRVLLPNLAKIHCVDPDYPSALNWLSVLVSLSVRSVGFVGEARWPPGSHPHLLAKIASKSPDLGELNIYRGGRGAHRTKDAHWHSASAYHENLIEGLAAFQKLRKLTGHTALLYPSGLQVLGSLPSLCELVVHIDDVPPLEHNSSMSDDLFPSLRRLFITGIESASWITSLWHINPLVKHLKSIHLCIGLQDSAESEMDGCWPDDFLLQICDSSPQISDIFAVFSDPDICEEEITVSASLHVLKALGQLPLKSFWLGNIDFGGRASCKVLSSIWPNITTLYCGQQSADLADLVDFARNLPHLEILVLDLDMRTSGIPDYSAPSFIPVPRHTAFRCLARDPPKPYGRTRSGTLKLAKYLHYLWPNVHCAISFYDLTEIEPGYYGLPLEEEGQRELNRLDACINRLRLESLVSQ